MKTLGLTGSIATGKSTVLAMFADLGVPVFSADAAVHDLYDGAAAPAIDALFPGVVHSGRVDRSILARRLIDHPERFKALEAIVHPLVRQRIAAFIAEAQSTGAPLAVVDIPLLFESPHDYGLDAAAVTVADPADQCRRALARPGMTPEKLDAILARQMPQGEKVSRADYVIDTSVPLEETRAQVARLVDELTGGPPPI